MHSEASEAPAAVSRFLAAEIPVLQTLAERLRAEDRRNPRALLTLARGSSDHAAQYLAYLVMSRLGQLVTSLPMSLITLYPARLRCEGLLAMALSQSGQSPDLVAALRHIGERGGQTLAFVNDAASPLAHAAQHVVALHAGPELSVAATKSFICQLAAGAALVAHWGGQADLAAALQGLPQALRRALAHDWRSGVETLRGAQRLYVIARGTGLPVAQEMALKLKEVCNIQAEAFSGAEVQHGPMALVEAGFPLLVLAPRGPAQAGLLALAEQMRTRGAVVLLAAPAGTPGCELPIAQTDDPDLDPISAVQSFYLMVEALARARQLDPDQPRHLQKVTRTK